MVSEENRWKKRLVRLVAEKEAGVSATVGSLGFRTVSFSDRLTKQLWCCGGLTKREPEP